MDMEEVARFLPLRRKNLGKNYFLLFAMFQLLAYLHLFFGINSDQNERQIRFLNCQRYIFATLCNKIDCPRLHTASVSECT